ncbi:MAG: hypothetical protein HYY04_16245 [Chloroflexi bacterium]|nr:hypothetical protein [Chloroflexota bacterium]
MELRDYWLVLSKRWWVIVLVAVVAVAASVGFSRLQPRVYRATVKLTVSPSRFDYGLTLVIENLLRQYSQQLQTDKVAAQVNENLQLDLPTEKLRGKVRVSPVSEDYLLELTVDDPDPNRARDIAFVWADQFVKAHQIRMEPVDPKDRILIELLDRPRPGDLYYPKTQQFALAAGVLGLVIGAVLAFLLEFLDDTIKTTAEVERYTNLSLLGVIPVLTAASSAASADGRAALPPPVRTGARRDGPNERGMN